MKNTPIRFVLGLIIPMLILFLSESCDKSENKGSVPVVSTAGITGITQSTAIGGGTVSSDGGSAILAKGVCWSTNIHPTISDQKTSDGNGTAAFVSNLTGLAKGTKYYVRAWATNNSGTGYGNELEFTTSDSSNLQTINDVEGNIYPVVTIGSQVWMAKNLTTTRYNDNTTIPLVSDNNAWFNLSSPGYCWYSNNKVMFGDTFGALYNWYVVNTGKLCPVGWHVPTDAEWTALSAILGGENTAGGKLKEAGTAHWNAPNTGAVNTVGFTALPGGSRFDYGLFSNKGIYGHWWTATENDSLNASSRYMHYSSASVATIATLKRNGFSVRCVKD